MEIIMPKLGLTMTEGRISAWLVQEGQEVRQGDILFEFESDKSTIEYEAPHNGVVGPLLVPVGRTVPCGTVVARLQTARESAAMPAAASGAPAPKTAAALPTAMLHNATPAAKRRARELGLDLTRLQGRGPHGRIHLIDVQEAAAVQTAVTAPAVAEINITPVARRLAADLGVDLSALADSAAGRITRADVLAAVRSGDSLASPAVADSHFSSREKLSGVRKVIAAHMSASAAAPHVTLHTEVNAAELVAARRQLNESMAGDGKISFNALLVAIVAAALRQFPEVNSCLLEDEVCLYADVHVGLAVDTQRGLLVPVIRNADKLSIRQIQETGDQLIARAVAGKSLPDDLTGGTFTITNLGMFGIDTFTPIINQPQAAILGVGRILNKPVGENGALVLRDRLTLSLSFDHRLVDGAPAARFLQQVGRLVERPYALLL